jgi:hypothetical protein
LGALAAGAERLACGCGNADCPAAAGGDERVTGVVVHVVAETSALTAQPDPHLSGEPPSPAITADTPLVRAPDPEPDPPAVKPAAVISGGGLVPGRCWAR